MTNLKSCVSIWHKLSKLQRVGISFICFLLICFGVYKTLIIRIPYRIGSTNMFIDLKDLAKGFTPGYQVQYKNFFRFGIISKICKSSEKIISVFLPGYETIFLNHQHFNGAYYDIATSSFVIVLPLVLLCSSTNSRNKKPNEEIEQKKEEP